jgi:hypothetical protein
VEDSIFGLAGQIMNYRKITLDKKSQSLQRFFHDLPDEPVIVECQGKSLCVVYPVARLSYHREGELRDSAGAWELPDKVAEAIAGNSN